MKKLMNNANDFVDESLSGIIKAFPESLKFADSDERAVVRADKSEEPKVAIVTGGGYGHLPLFLGYVGKGLCDGVAVGNVFTSPSSEAIYDAAKAVENGKGVLFLFGNYTGDVMNFDMARELLAFEDIEAEIVTGADDLASMPRDKRTDRRGVAGIVFEYKLAGAKADEGAELSEIVDLLNKAGENIASMGVSFSSCGLPGAEKQIFEIGDDEMELGMGIHGEPGVSRGKMETSAELAKQLSDRIIEDLSLKEGEEVAVLINGLGGTSREELFVFYNDVKKYLDEKGFKVFKAYVEEYATSMEMQGMSLSLFRVDEEDKRLLSAPARTPFVVF